jgi:UDP-N-acetylmuramoyl-tripeptide--D-alanyl-D-alanine ligase
MSALMTLAQAASWMPGARVVGLGDTPIARVHTDTRTVEPGDLFVALKGERYDANHFLHEARQRGAVAVVCHAGLSAEHLPADLPRIEVPHTTQALGQLAQGWRAQFPIPLIAITGSNGKTTVTQMVASILEAFAPDGAALATRGNLNNDIGVPLTLLRLRASHRIAVVELGMNHPGEIATLAAFALPTVALVNNAQREHLEFMHTVEAVARENGSVLSALSADGVAVFPSDDAYASVWQNLSSHARAATFRADAQHSASTLALQSASWSDGAWQVHAQGLGVELRYRLAIAGRHNVKNSLAAAACALSAGVDAASVVRGLKAFVPVKGRSRAFSITLGNKKLSVVDDTYNANPDSVRAAIDVLADLPGPTLLVLGDMGEVGEQGPQFHTEAGAYAHSKRVGQLLVLGDSSRYAAQAFAGARHFATVEELNAAVLQALPSVASVLIKGSRFMRMERVVEAVTQYEARNQEKSHAL